MKKICVVDLSLDLDHFLFIPFLIHLLLSTKVSPIDHEKTWIWIQKVIWFGTYQLIKTPIRRAIRSSEWTFKNQELKKMIESVATSDLICRVIKARFQNPFDKLTNLLWPMLISNESIVRTRVRNLCNLY